MLTDLQEALLFRGIFSVSVQRRHWRVLGAEASFVLSCHWNVAHRQTGLRDTHAGIRTS